MQKFTAIYVLKLIFLETKVINLYDVSFMTF